MTYFKASNSTVKTNHLFYRRMKYKLEFGKGASDKALEVVRDFTFSDYVSYGKVNQIHETIIPRFNLLKNYQLGAAQATPVGMIEFVADQLNDFLDNVSKRILVGKVPKGSFLNSLKPVGGYADPFIEYEKYFNLHLTNFHKTYVKDLKQQIMSFDDYLKTFYVYLQKLAPEFPCTLTGWYKSKKGSPFCSGLYVDLGGLSKHRDSEKEKFVLDSSFPHYLNACKQYGFFVSKNNPNIIVSDLFSPATAPYLYEYKVFKPSAVFDLYYTKTSDYDLQILMEMLIGKYKQFRGDNPDRRKFLFGKNGHMVSQLTPRRLINNIDIYTNKYIIYYIKIRNIEENNYYSKPDLEEVIENMIFLSKTFDRNKLMSYINLQFTKNATTREGSINWFKKRMEDK